MGLFTRKKKETEPGIWEALDAKQRAYAHRLADWLGRKASGVPPKQLRKWVIAALLSVALLNGVTLVVALKGHHDHPPPGFQSPAVSVRPLRRPRNPGQSLKHYLDSLRGDPVGSKLLDSLFNVRPGLADTLREVEGMTP